jgi:hypothetical protein
MSTSLLFLSSPVIRSRKYAPFFSNLVPFAPVVACGESSPDSGCPYICGSLPLGNAGPRRSPAVAEDGVRGVPGGCGVVARGVPGSEARGMFGIEPVAGCGVVGQPGERSSDPKPPSLRGSYITYVCSWRT